MRYSEPSSEEQEQERKDDTMHGQNGRNGVGLLALLLVLLLALSACGGSGGGGDSGARATAQQLADALGNGDAQAGQAVFGTPWDITNYIQSETSQFGAARSARVERVETEGTQGLAVTVWELEQATIRNVWILEQRGDQWVVTMPTMTGGRDVTPR
jgi:hypothetical protein